MAKIILQNVRGSYVYVNEQRTKKNGDPDGWGIQIIMSKDHPQIKAFKKMIKAVLIEKFGSEAGSKTGKYKLPLRDGDDERDGEEYENMYFMNASSKKKKPGIANRAGEPADQDDIEEYCFSGAYFHVSVNVYGFPSTDGGKPGIALGLNNVMLRKKGDRLDGSVAATTEFADFADDGAGNDDFDDF